MNKIKFFLMNNKTVIFMILVLFFITCYSVFSYIKTYYGYDYDAMLDAYNYDVQKCESGEGSVEWCSSLNVPLKPMDELRYRGAKYMFITLLSLDFGDILCLGLPFIIFVMVISKIHIIFSSGSIKNVLMRESFKKYKYKMNKNIIVISLIAPLFLFILFFICCVVTRFNFDVPVSLSGTSSYDKWIFDNMTLYLFIHYILLVFACIFYGNIAGCFVNKSKKMIISVFYSFLTLWAIFTIFTQLQRIDVIYNLDSIIPHLYRYLNIFDFFTLCNIEESIYGHVVVAIILAGLSYMVRCFVFRNKEKVLMENEKGII